LIKKAFAFDLNPFNPCSRLRESGGQLIICGQKPLSLLFVSGLICVICVICGQRTG